MDFCARIAKAPASKFIPYWLLLAVYEAKGCDLSLPLWIRSHFTPEFRSLEAACAVNPPGFCSESEAVPERPAVSVAVVRSLALPPPPRL